MYIVVAVLAIGSLSICTVQKSSASVNKTSTQKSATLPNILQQYDEKGGGDNPTDKFLSTSFLRQNIAYVYFQSTLITNCGSGGTLTNATTSMQPSGTVNACSYSNYKNTGLKGVVISANGKITLPKESNYLFAYLGYYDSGINKISIDFNNSVIDAITTNMSHMFYSVGNNAIKVESLTISSFPADFGLHAVNMFEMFNDYAMGINHLQTLNLPVFPAGFGMVATDLRYMFDGFAENVNYPGTTIDWSRTPNFVISVLTTGMFNEFNYGNVNSTLEINCQGNAESTLSAFSNDKASVFKQCIVTFNTQGGSFINDQEIVQGNKAHRPYNPNRTGWAFKDWYTDILGLGSAFDFNTQITTNITLFAKWTINIYTIKIINGNVVLGNYKHYGEIVIIKANNPPKNYHFSNWTSNNSNVQAQLNNAGTVATFIMPNTNITITANYALNLKVSKIYSSVASKIYLKSKQNIKIPIELTTNKITTIKVKSSTKNISVKTKNITAKNNKVYNVKLKAIKVKSGTKKSKLTITAGSKKLTININIKKSYKTVKKLTVKYTKKLKKNNEYQIKVKTAKGLYKIPTFKLNKKTKKYIKVDKAGKVVCKKKRLHQKVKINT
jgi:uncharacterized repeat protein (TIGR02543 family)